MFIYYTSFIQPYVLIHACAHMHTLMYTHMHSIPWEVAWIPLCDKTAFKEKHEKKKYIKKLVSRPAGIHTEVGKYFNSVLHHLPVTTDASAFSMYVSYICGIHVYHIHNTKNPRSDDSSYFPCHPKYQTEPVDPLILCVILKENRGLYPGHL